MFEKLKYKLNYNIAHRKEVIRIEKQYIGRNTLLTCIHDMDKMIMMLLFIPDKMISKIHRMFSWHHPKNIIGWFRISEAIFDWESARFTKPDKPLNARQTCIKYYPYLKNEVFNFCDKYKIN